MGYYTPVNLNQEDIDTVNNTKYKEDYTFIYFCLIIMFVFCPLVGYITLTQPRGTTDERYIFNIPVVTEPKQPYEINPYVKEGLNILSQTNNYIASYFNKYNITTKEQGSYYIKWANKQQNLIIKIK